MSIHCPIVYGTIATPIADSGDHTHKWTVYVRGFNDEDISYYIKKVTFKLHESFAEPLRVVEKFPFEQTETGWGEFEIQIKVYLIDQRILSINHFLRLHYDASIKQVGESIISEKYDEVVFDESSLFKGLLENNRDISDINPNSERYIEYSKLKEKALEEINRGKEKVDSEIKKYQTMIEKLERTM